jgi:tetratricopeptide (TPR) repeat protein
MPTNLGGRIIGFVLAVIILGYLAVLATSFLGKWRHQKSASAAPSPAVAAPVATNAVSSASASDAEAAEKIRLSIRLWGRAPDILQEARRLMDKGAVAQAIDKLETGLDLTPDVVEMKLLLAEAYLKKDELSPAIALLTEVLDADPLQPTARSLLASSLILQKQYKTAIAIAEWMVETGDDSARVHQIAATGYLNTDQDFLAIPHLRKIVGLDPDNAIAWNNLGVAYTRQGDYKRAVEAFDTLLHQNTANAVTYYNLSACYAKQVMAAQTVSTLTRAANVFGQGFVNTWMSNADFNAVRNDPLFVEFQKMLGTNQSESATASPAMLQIIDPMNAGQNVTPLQPEDLFRTGSSR